MSGKEEQVQWKYALERERTPPFASIWQSLKAVVWSKPLDDVMGARQPVHIVPPEGNNSARLCIVQDRNAENEF
jgi:hypothetical protein